MAAITAVQKNCENRKIPNPSLIGIAQVFSPQIRRKLEFSSIIPYNDSTVSLCATKAAVWVYSHAAFIFLFHTSEADCMFYSDKPISSNNEDKLNRKGFAIALFEIGFQCPLDGQLWVDGFLDTLPSHLCQPEFERLRLG